MEKKGFALPSRHSSLHPPTVQHYGENICPLSRHAAPSLHRQTPRRINIPQRMSQRAHLQTFIHSNEHLCRKHHPIICNPPRLCPFRLLYMHSISYTCTCGLTANGKQEKCYKHLDTVIFYKCSEQKFRGFSNCTNTKTSCGNTCVMPMQD